MSIRCPPHGVPRFTVSFVFLLDWGGHRRFHVSGELWNSEKSENLGVADRQPGSQSGLSRSVFLSLAGLILQKARFVFGNWQVLVPTNTGDVSQLNFAKAQPPFAATVAGVSHQYTRPMRDHPCAIMIFLFNGLQSIGAPEPGQLGHFANSKVESRKTICGCGSDVGPAPGRGDPHGAIFSESLKNLDPAAFPSRSTVSPTAACHEAGESPAVCQIELPAFNAINPLQPPLVSCQLSAAFTISASVCF